MLIKCFYIWIFFELHLCEHKITLEDENLLRKKYLVYFVKASVLKPEEDTWVCGGALVSPTQILTAAACLIGVRKIYAVAGYEKYVNSRNIDKDQCTKIVKQKVVKISIPKGYNISSEVQKSWPNVDIGVAMVEKPYNFSDIAFSSLCSYEPYIIEINFDKKNELEKTRAVALSWGRSKDINSRFLEEISTTIVEKKTCKMFSKNSETRNLIKKYLMCISANSRLYEEETNIVKNKSFNFNLDCLNDTKNISNISCFGRRRNENNGTTILMEQNINITEKINTSKNRSSISRGKCQDGHGSPLVTWVDYREVIIGVALRNILDYNYDCLGLYLYVSTADAAQIIKCLLEMNPITLALCNENITDEKYKVNEINIEWLGDSKSIRPLNNTVSFLERNETQPSPERFTVEPKNSHHITDQQRIMRAYDFAPIEKQMYSSPKYLTNRKELPDNRVYTEHKESDIRSHINPYSRQGYSQTRFEDSYKPQPPNNYDLPQESYRQPQVDNIYSKPQEEFYKQPKEEKYPELKIKLYKRPQFDIHNNQSQIENCDKCQTDTYYKPQADTYYKPKEDIYFKPKLETQHYSPKEETYVHPQMESYHPLHEKNYNQRQIEFHTQPPQWYKQQKVNLFKLKPDNYIKPSQKPFIEQPVISPFKPQPLVVYKQPMNGYYSQSPPPVVNYDPTHLPSVYDPNTQQYVKYYEQPAARSPLHVIEDNQHQQFNILRQLPPSHDSQFESGYRQMYSPLNAPVADSTSLPPEETFDELYRYMHDPTLNMPNQKEVMSSHVYHSEQQFSPHKYEPSGLARYESSNPNLLSGSHFYEPPELQIEGQREPQFEQQWKPPQYEGRRDPQFEGRREPQFEGRREPDYEEQREPRYEAKREDQWQPRYEGRREPPFEGQYQPQFDGPQEPQFDGPRQPQFDGPREPQFYRPREPKYDQLQGSQFEGNFEPPLGQQQPPQYEGQRVPQFENQQPPQFEVQREPQFGVQRPPQFEEQRPSQYEGQRPLQFGEQLPPQFEGQQPPQFEGQQPPQFEEQRPSHFEEQRPSQFEGQQPQQFEGQQPPQFEGQQPPQFEGQQPPQFEGQQPPQFEGQQPPQFEEQQPPQYEERQPPQYEEHRPQHFEVQREPQFGEQRPPHFEGQLNPLFEEPRKAHLDEPHIPRLDGQLPTRFEESHSPKIEELQDPRFEDLQAPQFEEIRQPRFGEPTNRPRIEDTRESQLNEPQIPRFEEPRLPRFDEPQFSRFEEQQERQFEKSRVLQIEEPRESQFEEDRAKEFKPRFEEEPFAPIEETKEPRYDLSPRPSFEQRREQLFEENIEPQSNLTPEQPPETQFEEPQEPRFERPWQARFDQSVESSLLSSPPEKRPNEETELLDQPRNTLSAAAPNFRKDDIQVRPQRPIRKQNTGTI